MDLPLNTVHVWISLFKKNSHSRDIAQSILSKYLPIKDIIFETNAHGKPYLKNHALEFNVSHAGDYLLMAITKNKAVGIDIECEKKTKNYLDIAQRFFAPTEYEKLMTLPASQQTTAFYRCWALKEAFIKATGEGLSYGLANFEVDFLSDPSAKHSALLHSNEKTAWTLHALPLDFSQYYAAICVKEGYTQYKWHCL